MAARREALAERRRARGFSQEGLAQRLRIERSTVGRWERGETDPAAWIRPSLARALEVTLDELDDLLAAASHPAPDGDGHPLALATPEFFRRSAQRALAFAEALAVPVEPVDVETLHLQVADIAGAYLVDPLDAVLPKIQALRARCEALLASAPRSSPDLLVVLARTLALLANAAMDMGEHIAADEHAQAAIHLADAVGHRGVAAWASGLRASNAFWAGAPTRSGTLAAAALAAPGQGTTPVYLACLLARAAGRVGDHRGVATALTRAQDARERLDEDEVGGVFGFSQAKQHLYAASAHLGADGNPARALEHAQRAVVLYRRSPRRNFGDEAGARLDMATSYLRLGEPDGAIEALEPVLILPAAMRVATVRTRLMRVSGELASGYGNLPAACETVDRIGSTLTAAPWPTGLLQQRQ